METKLSVSLIQHTPEPERVIAGAGEIMDNRSETAKTSCQR